MTAIKSFLAALLCVGFLSVGTAYGESIERVEFRLMNWKSLHFDDAAQAKEYYDTFKNIGCECKQESHGNHTDVTFRAPKWRALNLKSHAEAHKWEAFLKKAGFETKHEH